jgi:WD40 repeat protein/DNA-binding SARP family transcriptional activator
MRSLGRTAVQFRILGPLTATFEGEALALGGERQRALLAVLLVHANEMLSTERLIEQLFGDTRAPRSGSAANAVHVAVSRLRRALGDEGSEMLLTRRGGYMLELEDGQLDAAVFERLVDEGRALLAHEDAAAASARLREALELWRGPPLAGLSGVEELHAEIRRLEELRLLAEMERIDAELALGRAAEVVVELERLIAVAPLQERLRGQMMLALYRSGRQADALAAYRAACTLLRDELGLTPSAELRELECMILRHDPGLEVDRQDNAPASPVVCPFKGLAAFESSDAEFFCGRDRVISELVARLAEWPLVGILGPSGIGKSSLLRAGVLPALRAGALPGSAGWRQVLLRPGGHPCEELERALGEDIGQAVAGVDHGARIVVAVDQLEELFTVCESEAERCEFLERLVSAASDHERRVVLLCTLRADFYGRISAYPEFADLLSRSHALVGPLDRDELKETIERPAARAGLEVERPLVEALVEEVAEEPGGLPLLSTTLLELWQARSGRVLRLQDYRATGGVRGAVARIAEAAYMRLSDPQRRVARGLLLRLAEVGDGAPERRSVPLEEIDRIDGAEPVLEALTDARLVTVGSGAAELSHEALLREWPRYRAWLDEDRVGRRLHAHLRIAAGEWNARGRDPADLYRGARLAGALELCAQHPEEMDRLERAFVAASRSEADREVRRQRTQNRRLRALLIGAAVLLVLTVVAGAVAVIGQQRARSDARLAVAEEHAALGRQLGEEAVNEPKLDVAALLAREAVALDASPQTEGTLLSTLMRSPAVIATFSMPTNSTPNVSVAPDGHTVAVADGVADQIRFYDTRTRAPVGRLLTDFFGDQPPTYSADGSVLVYSAGAFLAVRDARTLSLRKRLLIGPPFSKQQAADVPDASVMIGPGRRTVYYAYWLLNQAGQPTDAYLARWSMPSGRRLPTVRLGSGPLLAVSLIDGGAEVMVVTAHDVDTYDARTLRLERSVAIALAPASPSAAAVSPDGATIAIGAENGSVSFVDAATGVARPGAGGHTAAVASVVYDPDGGRVMTAGDDGRVIVWDPATATEAAVLPGPAGHVEDAKVSPDGSTLYTSAIGGVVLAWDLTGRRSFGHSARLDRGLPCCDTISPPEPALALSPDGSRFAVPIAASTVGLFSTRTLARLRTFTIAPGDDPITALAWSPAGATLAVGAHGGVVQVWDVSGAPRLERTLYGLAPVPELSEAVQSLAFSPDGRLLAGTDKIEGTTVGHTLASPLATMAIWDIGAGMLVGPTASLGAGNGLTGSDEVAFSRDGKLLAASLLVGGVSVFDPSTGQLLRTLADPGDESTSVAFGTGDTLAAGTIGGAVELWDAATGEKLVPALFADTAEITDVAFDQSGRRFVTTGDEDGTIKLWFTAGLQQEGPRLAADPDSTSAAAFEPGAGGLLVVDDRGGARTWPTSLVAWEQRACSVAGRNLTRAEWAELVGGPRYTTVCP